MLRIFTRKMSGLVKINKLLNLQRITNQIWIDDIYRRYVFHNDSFDYAFENINQAYALMGTDKDIYYYTIRDLFYDAKDKLKDEPEYETKEIVCKSIDNGLKMLDNPDLKEFYAFDLCKSDVNLMQNDIIK